MEHGTNSMNNTFASLAVGAIFGGFVATITVATLSNTEEEYTEAEVLPLNGEFSCTYHKARVMHVENVVNFSVTDNQAGWNWSLELKDGSVLFFTQGTDKLCFITHVEEEGNV